MLGCSGVKFIMRRTIITGVIVVFSALSLTWIAGASGQRVREVDAATTRMPTQVEVTNFPPVQNVVGTVAVSNLPSIQQVSGSVNVGNLPTDESGRILVSVQSLGSAGALILHSTTAMYQGNLGGRTGATQKCRAEFPKSHFPSEEEIRNALLARGVVWLSSEIDWSWVDTIMRTSVNCFEWQAATNTDGSRIDGDLVRARGTDLFNGGPCSDSHPILCAE